MPKARLIFDGDNIYTEKDARIYKLKNDISSKIDGIPGVVDSLDSTSTTDALSANKGRQLQDQINSLSGTGKFLSTWDCTTGLPGTNPQEDPYTYKVGDYYVVSATGATNYRPHGGTFTQGVPSTAVELENVGINDKYYFDGANWVRIPDTAIQIGIDSSLSTTSTNAVENRVVTNALNQKQGTISDLAAIRSGAAAGATALQPNANISQLTNNVGYQTAGDVASAIAGKQDVLTAGDGISLTNNIVTNTKPGAAVSNTAPSNPTEGMLWYDTTNDVLKSYDGNNWNEVGSDAADINTKTFYLSSTSDLTNAQDAYDWYLAGGNPIVLYQNRAYIVYDKQPTLLDFSAAGNVTHGTLLQSSSRTLLAGLQFYLNSNTVTGIDNSSHEIISGYLEINKNYSTPYIPQYDGSPATKKYVDDSVADVIPSGSTAPQNPQEGDLWYDTVNDKLMVYDGTNWVEVGSDAADINTKTFYLSSTSDLTNAQAAYDWYKAGKNPIIIYDGNTYVLHHGTNLVVFRGYVDASTSGSSSTVLKYRILSFAKSGDTITSITYSTTQIQDANFLSTNVDYGTPYTPQYNGSPATKKYVDDKMSSGGISPSNPTTGQLRYDTINNILMVYDGTNWVEVSSSAISDVAFSSSWDGDTTHAPSKNAIYDVLGDVETLLANL